MIPARWQQVADLLHDAMQLAPSERMNWLESLGATDPELRKEVEATGSSGRSAGAGWERYIAPFATTTSIKKKSR